ncbi:HD domain-containing protein [Christiangramia sp. ASW11-125]|uniref:Ppx/GppA phosphatase family protein n=1 Tax=Christiangramia sp. ASW11-125 TaxID=3400701 RepID=UPI003AAC4C6E
MENPSETVNANKRIAAIDLGTNSFHAVLVDIYPDGSFRTVDKLKEMVILAEKGMDNKLSEEAMQRGLDAMKRIKFLCDSMHVEEIIAFATSAIREATNGGDFIQRMKAESGIKVRAISGSKEAALIGLAVQHSIALSEELVLMVDIGGGSVEFILGNNEKFLYSQSLKLGVARMAAKFVSHDPINKEEIKDLKKHYKKELGELSEILAKHKVRTIIGSSGTMENIGAMIANRNSHTANMSLNELVFDVSEFKKLYKNFIQLDRKEREDISELDEKRIDIINPGMVLVKYLVKEFEIEEIKISEAALRDGMILDFIKKERPKLDLVANYPEPRKRSVHELLRKCHWMEDHSRHVAAMSLQLFDAFQKDLKLEEADRELLEYAALMHDIGYYINYRKHHKHTLYIIRHADLRGFNEDEINIMAHTARYHRRTVPKKRHYLYKQLSKKLRKRIEKLAALLRLADGLDRSHYQNVQELEIIRSSEKIRLQITTLGDPELEVWGGLRKADLLKDITGKEIEIITIENQNKQNQT